MDMELSLPCVKLLAQILKLWAHFSDDHIKNIRLDNAREFTSKTFLDFYFATGIKVEHYVAHVHTQNRLAELLIKRLQWISQLLLFNSKLSIIIWGHVIPHIVALIHLRPLGSQTYSPIQLALVPHRISII